MKRKKNEIGRVWRRFGDAAYLEWQATAKAAPRLAEPRPRHQCNQ